MRIRKNKPLIYTVATNDENAFSCSSLLIKSLKRFLKEDDFDFKIVVPESDSYSCSEELKSYIFPIYNYHYKNQHIFTLKYHYKIFDQPYDYFIYIDSDILWMISKLYDLKYNCICSEQYSMRSKFFSRFWPNTVDKSQSYRINGINAGFFGLKKKIALELSDFMIKVLYTKTKSKPLFEQNMFNLFVYDYYLKNSLDTWQNINYKFILGAQPESSYIPETAYHFSGNGDMGNMLNKMNRMNNFLNNNNITLQ